MKYLWKVVVIEKDGSIYSGALSGIFRNKYTTKYPINQEVDVGGLGCFCFTSRRAARQYLKELKKCRCKTTISGKYKIAKIIPISKFETPTYVCSFCFEEFLYQFYAFDFYKLPWGEEKEDKEIVCCKKVKLVEIIN